MRVCALNQINNETHRTHKKDIGISTYTRIAAEIEQPSSLTVHPQLQFVLECYRESSALPALPFT